MPSSDDLILPPGSEPISTDGAALIGMEAQEAMFQAARKAGLFCSSCGGPMNGDGWEYVSIRTEVREGIPTAVTARAYICGRGSCTDARASLEQTAAARRPWAPWHIFDVENDEVAAPDPAPES